MTYNDTEDTEPYEVMNPTRPIFTCPSCGKNIFDVGLTECATGADISTVIDFKQAHLNVYETQISSAGHKWIKCNNCHNGIKIDVDQLDAVFSGRCTEEQIKIQCKIIQRPVFRCPQCRVDIFKAGINEVTTGGLSHTEITFDNTGETNGDTCIEDVRDQWSECNNCNARIDINATDLINYYNGDCALEDITSE